MDGIASAIFGKLRSKSRIVGLLLLASPFLTWPTTIYHIQTECYKSHVNSGPLDLQAQCQTILRSSDNVCVAEGAILCHPDSNSWGCKRGVSRSFPFLSCIDFESSTRFTLISTLCFPPPEIPMQFNCALFVCTIPLILRTAREKMDWRSDIATFALCNSL